VPPIRLHDTRSGRLVDLEPRDPGKVSIYACGPTVYNRIHVGNARPFVVFALLKRFLEHEGYDVTFVANITDVNDKIYDAARPLGRPSDELAREMTAHYVADTDALGLGRPDHEPLASETIGPIVGLIQTLLDNGSAYAVDGDVYFRVRSDPGYGELSHRAVDDMDQGEGVAGSDRKEDPLDFALWKAQKGGEDTAWDAPWGRGRPGWHIECSAMAEELLGVGFDIHGGGNDLVFPHHENEAAQTRAARGAELAAIWMHNGMLQLGGEKMAKSVGNIASLPEALEEAGRDALIMFFCGAHYRQPIAYSEDSIAQAVAGVRRIREAARRLEPGPSPPDMAPLKDRFFAALADDFKTPEALAAVWEWVREANRRGTAAPPAKPVVGDADLREMLAVLGLDNLLDAGPDAAGPDDAARDLLDRREAARAAKDFDEADRLRDELRAAGWEVRDGPEGPELVGVDR
jgi:cysteinyl-tRNA synthetase